MIEEIYNANALYDAFQLSKTGSAWKSSVQRYELNLLRNIFKTKEQLKSGTYKQKPFYEFELNERGKIRHIKSLHISDRVVQRSLCDNVLTCITNSRLIYDNGASVKDKGISFARKRVNVHLRKYYEKYRTNEGYVLQIDFRKFFDSIPHDKLKELFRAILTDDTYWLFSDLIDTFDIDGKPVSVGIGSQISQICGVFYPTIIDNYFKIVKRCKYYGRYMDDTYIIDNSKEHLQDLLKDYLNLANEYGLVVNLKKTHIVKLSHGFTFLKIKYNLLPDGKIVKRLSRASVTRERRKLKKYRRMMEEGILSLDMIVQAYQSWRGSYKKFNSHTTMRSMDKLFNQLYGGIYYGTDIERTNRGKNRTAQV